VVEYKVSESELTCPSPPYSSIRRLTTLAKGHLQASSGRLRGYGASRATGKRQRLETGERPLRDIDAAAADHEDKTIIRPCLRFSKLLDIDRIVVRKTAHVDSLRARVVQEIDRRRRRRLRAKGSDTIHINGRNDSVPLSTEQ
jgi:hypothetical protein